MIECPKCSFSQPKDQYCANCGINMETFTPERPPMWITVLRNWMFQLALLITIIIGFVVYDGGSAPQTSRQPMPELRAQTTSPEETPVATVTSSKKRRSAKRKRKKSSSRSATKETSNTQKLQLAAVAQPKSVNTQKANSSPAIQVSFYRIDRESLLELQRENPGTFSYSGDMAGGLLDKEKIKSLLKNRSLVSLSTNRYKEYNTQKPINIFKGKRTESGHIGLQFVLRPSNQKSNSARIRVEGWSLLKEQDGETALFDGDITINSQTTAFFTNFVPKGMSFSDEEKRLFETHRFLEILNLPEFSESSVDLIMFIELTK